MRYTAPFRRLSTTVALSRFVRGESVVRISERPSASEKKHLLSVLEFMYAEIPACPCARRGDRKRCVGLRRRIGQWRVCWGRHVALTGELSRHDRGVCRLGGRGQGHLFGRTDGQLCRQET